MRKTLTFLTLRKGACPTKFYEEIVDLGDLKALWMFGLLFSQIINPNSVLAVFFPAMPRASIRSGPSSQQFRSPLV